MSAAQIRHVPRDAEPPVDLAGYFERQRELPPRYLGQLEPAFQAALARHYAHVAEADCEFYHTIEAPDGTLHRGTWDLRGHEAAYVGGVALDGASVLEFGPASGWLSAHIAARGRLTVLDMPFGAAPDMLPFPGTDMAAGRRAAAISMDRLRASWWFTRRLLGFEARAVYADIYRLPADLGRFQVAFFGAVLLHLGNPFLALQQAASITDEAIVVTDIQALPEPKPGRGVVTPRPSGLVFSPSPAPVGLTHWWNMSPQTVEQMLQRLGFGDVETTLHRPPAMVPSPGLFTVVGRRTGPAAGGWHAGVLPAAVAALPVPPPRLRMLVAGTEDERTFLELGQRGFDALVGCLQRNAIPVAGLGRVLDFGCGVGRVARFWVQHPAVRLDGSDLAAEQIAWAREHLPFASFQTNSLEPVLAYEDHRFGLVYALSVFTHLPVDMQASWLRELLRVLRPGGVLFISTHGERYVDLLTPDQLALFRAGAVVATGGERPGSNHCAAFHPAGWFARYAPLLGFEILEHVPCGARGNPEQDSWLLRRV